MHKDSIPPIRPRHSLADVPQVELVYRTIKIYLVGALAWDYTETILDQVVQMRLQATKKLSRTIRELRRDYDSVRAQDLDAHYIRREWELAETFESLVSDKLRRLHHGIVNETRHNHNLNRDYELLVESVQTAMTVLDALILYAGESDAFIHRYYPEAPHSILPDHFRVLAKLLPEFAGDCYDKNSPSRSITAKALLNEINAIEMYGKGNTTDGDAENGD